MKITKEDFNKLNQLDRIEYRQINSEIESKTKVKLFLDEPFFWGLFFMVGIVNIFLNSVINGLSLMILIYVIFNIVLKYLIAPHIEAKLKQQLENKYFKIVKKK